MEPLAETFPPGTPAVGAGERSEPDGVFRAKPEEDSVRDPRTSVGMRDRHVVLGTIDQFAILRKLGSGGFGVAYLAEDSFTHVKCVLKAILPSLKSNAETMDDLREKFALVQKLSHPCIATARSLHRAREVEYASESTAKDMGVVSGDPVMVVEYAPGEKLSILRKRFPKGRMPVEKALEICRQIADALDYAHVRGVIHRDIKPGNIFVSETDGKLDVKIIDFGLAASIRKDLSRDTREKIDTSGTRPYMAPEQWSGRDQDGRTDQYALAVVLHELVSGDVPFGYAFSSGDIQLMEHKVLHEPVLTVPQLSDGQNRALRKALAKDPADRFGSCREFVDAFAGTAPLAAEPAVKTRPHSFSMKKEDLVNALKGLAILVAIIAFVAVLAFVASFVGQSAKNMAGTEHANGELAMVLMAAAFVALAVVDHIVLLCRPRQPDSNSSPASSLGGDSYGPIEICPTCGEKLTNGECPRGHTIVRCSKCNSIMRDGICLCCGMGNELERCPVCNSELVTGECPRGHTIVRCPDCGSVLVEGICPKGCNGDPLNLGWPVGVEKYLSPFALRVVSCPKDEGRGFTLRVPDSFIVGRNATDAKEPFVELLVVTPREKAQCSRQYLRFDLGGENGAFTVTLLNSSRNPAFVDGKKLVMQGDTAPISLGSRIRLNPGYELELVEVPEEPDSPSTSA